MRRSVLIRAPWREPIAILDAYADEPLSLALLSDGHGARGRWSYLALRPDAVRVIPAGDPVDPFGVLRDLIGETSPADPQGPPFQGGVAGLLAYELGARVEGLDLQRHPAWPDAVLARYPSILAFDHECSEVVAIGNAPDAHQAQVRAKEALSWLAGAETQAPAGPLAAAFESGDGDAYERSVEAIRTRIAAGEIFQANIARRWRGRLAPGVRPFDLAARLRQSSPAPFAAYFRLAGLALVSNSPERFLSLRKEGGDWIAETRPIKGTAPRGDSPAQDAALAAGLAVSPKDRAENLMIVDLMRNDLARVCAPGGVKVTDLFAVETFANVHHLVSTVRGTLRAGMGPADLLRASFPPGSITGAPKVQAMRVIAELEPPRGPFFGAMVWAGFDGALDSSVLIRTAAFVQDEAGWAFETRAGGGIVADSEPTVERRETEAKIDALRRAMMGEAR